MGKQQWDGEEEKTEGAVVEELEEDELEEEEEDVDCFFESLDRVPSGVSIEFDAHSSSSDGEYDDVRFSFASAIAPPSDVRRLSVSDDDDEEEEGGPDYDCDYDIWMAEPISIDERRRRLLQGMGFTSNKDMAAEAAIGGGAGVGIGGRSRRSSLKLCMSHLSRGTAAPQPSFSPHCHPLTRSRSDTQAVLRELAATALFRRCLSAPPSLRDRTGGYHHQGWSGGGEGGRGGDGAALDSPLGHEGEGEGICRIKNLDTGKEFVVSEFGKDGTVGRLNDLQTGLQLTLEEFERFLGYSPIVKELMRRVNLGGSSSSDGDKERDKAKSIKPSSGRRKGGGWLKNIKFVASSVTGLISDKDRDCGPTSSSSPGMKGNEWMKVRQHGKSHKELTGLYLCQQIQAHQGSIWCIKFSSDSLYLASAGEDRVVHVWQVIESDTVSSSLLRHDSRRHSLPPLHPANGSPNQSARLSAPPSKRTRKVKLSAASRRNSIPDHIVMPETIFSLSDKPVCSFQGHLDDVLDLSWSKSQYLLSSSMDKTVRLWDMESKACLKLFAHNDYVTCIQFNPVDDRYFISGSLDAKVRIWSIPDRQVVDWTDLHEMVTAVCYTPNGQGALVGSHKGSCRFYNTSGYKLNQENQIYIRSKKRKSHAKKITGFQFAPGNPSEVLITSADSRIRAFDGVDMIHKFRGFRNTSSQISASFTSDGKYVVCASEDSHVYLWKRSGGKSKGLVTTRSHEHFYCKDVSVAIPWSGAGSSSTPALHPQHLDRPDSQRSTSILNEDNFHSCRSHYCRPLPKKSSSSSEHISPSSPEELRHSSRSFVSPSPSQRSDAISSASVSASSSSFSLSWGLYSGTGGSNRSSGLDAANAWGLVVVTAGLGGDIKIYQNFGLPIRLSRQSNLF